MLSGKSITIEGVVERDYVKVGNFGPQYRMWVVGDDGGRYLVTVPSRLIDFHTQNAVDYQAKCAELHSDWRACNVNALVGQRVRFVADVNADMKDPTVGFCKRPRKAELLERGVA